MKCSEIMAVIEQRYGKNYALDWDNVGLLVGRDNQEVSVIYIAVDATDEVIEAAAAAGADLLITHHPLIFSGMKRITNQDFIGRRVLRLIQEDISYYAMHTNYDVMGMADLAAKKLGWKDAKVLDVTGENVDGEPYGIGKIADLEKPPCTSGPIRLKDYCNQIKDAFSLDTVQVFGDLEKPIERAAICPGSGKSVIREAVLKGADVLITGDIGHHEGIDAAAQGMAVVDAGHYGIEKIFVADMAEYLKEHVFGVSVVSDIERSPFTVI